MTLKKEIELFDNLSYRTSPIYFSNFRLVLITIISLMLVPLLIRFVVYLLLNAGLLNLPADPEGLPPPGPPILFTLMVPAFFVIVMSVVKNIVRPLESLSEGVRQIQRHNFAYRID